MAPTAACTGRVRSVNRAPPRWRRIPLITCYIRSAEKLHAALGASAQKMAKKRGGAAGGGGGGTAAAARPAKAAKTAAADAPVPSSSAPDAAVTPRVHKEKVLVLSTRGITSR
eukprot:359925-Chlamydomonas_euryale.AAC.3